MYQEQTGSFPNSFADVSGFTKNKQWFDDFRGAMDQAHSNIWRDVYIYQLSTNRFAITVTGYDCAPVGWFGKKRTIKHDFKSDDPFNELN